MSRLKISVGGVSLEHSLHTSAGELSLGRSSKCDITIRHDGVSRRHALLRYEEGSWILKDCGSRNGLWIEGKRVGEVWLEPELTVKIGPASLTLLTEAPAAPATWGAAKEEEAAEDAEEERPLELKEEEPAAPAEQDKPLELKQDEPAAVAEQDKPLELKQDEPAAVAEQDKPVSEKAPPDDESKFADYSDSWRKKKGRAMGRPDASAPSTESKVEVGGEVPEAQRLFSEKMDAVEKAKAGELVGAAQGEGKKRVPWLLLVLLLPAVGFAAGVGLERWWLGSDQQDGSTGPAPSVQEGISTPPAGPDSSQTPVGGQDSLSEDMVREAGNLEAQPGEQPEPGATPGSNCAAEGNSPGSRGVEGTSPGEELADAGDSGERGSPGHAGAVEEPSTESPSAELPIPTPAEPFFPSDSDAEWLVGTARTIELLDGSKLQGTVLSVDRFGIGLGLQVSGSEVRATIPVENLRSVDGREVDPDWRGILDREPDNARAREELGFVYHEGEWQLASELLDAGLVEFRGKWVEPGDLEERGYIQQGDEWLSEREANRRRGLVQYGGEWMTPQEKRLREHGFVCYLGVWVPGPVAYRIHKEQFYERVLREFRRVALEDIEEKSRTFLAFHFTRAQEAEGRRLTKQEKQQEAIRVLAMLQKANQLSEEEFVVSLRVLADGLAYSTLAERHGVGRYVQDGLSASALEDRDCLSSLFLLEALELDLHQVWHLYLASHAGARCHADALAPREEVNGAIGQAFGNLREQLIKQVFSGFDIPRAIEGRAVHADHKLTENREQLKAGLLKFQQSVREILGEEKWEWACCYPARGLPMRATELKQRAQEARLERKDKDAPT